jgi:eukaryotic-like serine/threonine-protein kinase
MSAPHPERSERFSFQERLGEGASGTVHRAYDKQRGTAVAIKVLNQVDPSSLYRFKAEFRALTGMVHPNLVQLYDLVQRENEWLLTMELVEGCDFLRHVRPSPSSGAGRLSAAASGASSDGLDGATMSSDDFDDAPVRSLPPPARGSENDNAAVSAQVLRGSVPQELAPPLLGALDEGKLRSALRQLVEGLSALHQSNRLHRDLKPANVLVFSRDGRLVICDFGLVTDGTRVRGARESENGVGIAGTLAYMSPEQATGQLLTEASDWYAVGVMLYQALTSVLPFNARLSVPDAIAAKRQGVVVHPCSVASEAPEDLADLAVSLLAPDPAKRPRYGDIVARLDGVNKRPSLGPSAPQQLVGRGAQLEQLTGALGRARGGRATVVMVGGRSGMGKSALMQRFLDHARVNEHTVVLAGRCYEREELPYKAFDPLMDAMSAYLMQLDEGQARALLPTHIWSLARLFPVLRRVPAVADAIGRGEVIDPLEQKRRAFSAFRELCRNISQRQPLVLYIDDLQWGDLDSGPFFTELLHEPQPPALLVVAAYRSEDEDVSPLLRALRKTHLPEAGILPVEVRIEALSFDESVELAHTILEDGDDTEANAQRIATEAGGSPFFVRELALHVRARGGIGAGELKLETLIEARLDELPEDSRALFSLVAVAGRPEKRSILQLASKLGEASFSGLRLLEARNLVHSTGTTTDDRIEAYHDRLRETAYRVLSDGDKKRLHRELAEALEHSGNRDPEALYEHWRASDEPERAGGFALEAARNAESQLAFERAAKLYRDALSRLSSDVEQKRALAERLGHCLALAGRGVEAAAAFSSALVGASPAQSMQLRGLATTQLLRAGRVAEAYEELDRAHELTGLRVPRTDLSAVFMLLWRRLKIRFKKIRLRRNAGPSAPELLQRADLLWGVGASLVCMDNLRGAVYQAEHLLVALRANDAYRLARAFSVEAALSATGNKNPARTQFFIDRGLEVGGMSGESHSISAVKGTAGVCRMLEGRFREAVRLTREAQSVIRERLNATLAWDMVTVVIFDLQATAYLGNVQELIDRVPDVLRDAEARGDLYAATSCRTRRCIWAWLGPDDVEGARRQVGIAESQWVQAGYHLQHWYTTQARAEIDLYAGTPESSLARLASEWKKLIFLRKIQYTRIEVWYLRARLSLACAVNQLDASLLASARSDAHAIIKEGAHWGNALGKLMQACAASFDDVELCLRLLRELEGQFDALDMRLHYEVVRYRRGELTKGEEGASLVQRTESAIRSLGVASPRAFVAMLAPGFPKAASTADGRDVSLAPARQ